MSGIPIGELARTTGLAASAIRYYEAAGLLPKPSRRGGQRRYGPEAIGRLRIIQIARAAGFTVAETRIFLTGFSSSVPPAARWRSLAERKLAEIKLQLRRCAQMQQLLETSFRCGCAQLGDCEQALLASCDPPTGG